MLKISKNVNMTRCDNDTLSKNVNMTRCDNDTFRALRELGYRADDPPRLDDAAYWLRDAHEVFIAMRPQRGRFEAAIYLHFRGRAPLIAYTASDADYDAALAVALIQAINLIKIKINKPK